MENEHSGFKKLSDVAGDHLQHEGVNAGRGDMTRGASGRSRASGTDAGGAIKMAEDRVGELQDMLIEQVRERPFRAVGWAAAAGFVIGIMSAR